MHARYGLTPREYRRAVNAHMVSWLSFGGILLTATVGGLTGISLLLG